MCKLSLTFSLFFFFEDATWRIDAGKCVKKWKFKELKMRIYFPLFRNTKNKPPTTVRFAYHQASGIKENLWRRLCTWQHYVFSVSCLLPQFTLTHFSLTKIKLTSNLSCHQQNVNLIGVYKISRVDRLPMVNMVPWYFWRICESRNLDNLWQLIYKFRGLFVPVSYHLSLWCKHTRTPGHYVSILTLS